MKIIIKKAHPDTLVNGKRGRGLTMQKEDHGDRFFDLLENVSISAIDLTFLSSFSYVSLHFQHVKEHLHNTHVSWIAAQRTTASVWKVYSLRLRLSEGRRACSFC